MLKRCALPFVFLCFAAILQTGVAQGQDHRATADDYLNYLNPYFPGKWTLEVVRPDGKVAAQGTMEFHLKAGQRCGVSIGEGEDSAIVSSAIHGYDPSTRSWRVLQFSADGSMLEMKVTIDKDVLTAGKYKNVTYTHLNTLTKPDGTKEVSRWEATIVNRRRFELQQISGPPEQQTTMQFTRQQ